MIEDPQSEIMQILVAGLLRVDPSFGKHQHRFCIRFQKEAKSTSPPWLVSRRSSKRPCFNAGRVCWLRQVPNRTSSQSVV